MAPLTVVVGVDGSEESTRAVAAGLALLPTERQLVVVTTIEPLDPGLVTGTGMAGGTMSAETFEQTNLEQEQEGERLVAQVVTALGAAASGAETRVVRGNAGPTLCDLAVELGADAVVIGSRGRGGIKRAILGSVSDHVVRHARCPVIVTGPAVA
jgi:nucleotide-binding universal stress UspA family protein